ncbi:MAG TPA: SET domain-containing protein-lysine N-methyltransferase [Terriglobales bacterium]|nr:SET domain-containing protein-lysine N-methyltransferase [Terriglobales bacterium]
MGIIVRSSDIHAAGVYATSPIKKDTKIVEYIGPIVTRERADELYDGRPYTYLFALDDGRIIDGHGVAAFINHCCEPNCETDEIDGKIWIIALRDIQEGEELTYDYCLFDGEEDDEAPCYCGARKCRGTMYSDEEMERQKKLKKKELVGAK